MKAEESEARLPGGARLAQQHRPLREQRAQLSAKARQPHRSLAA